MNMHYPARVQAEFAALGVEVPGLADLAAISQAMAEAAETDPGEELAAAISTGKVTPANAGDKLLDAAGRQVAANAAQETYTRALHAISTAQPKPSELKATISSPPSPADSPMQLPTWPRRSASTCPEIPQGGKP